MPVAATVKPSLGARACSLSEGTPRCTPRCTPMGLQLEPDEIGIITASLPVSVPAPAGTAPPAAPPCAGEGVTTGEVTVTAISVGASVGSCAAVSVGGVTAVGIGAGTGVWVGISPAQARDKVRRSAVRIGTMPGFLFIAPLCKYLGPLASLYPTVARHRRRRQ